MELWAAIDLLGGSVVTLVQGKAGDRTTWRGTPDEIAERWQEEGADGLHIVDLDAAFGTGSNRDTILRITHDAYVPIEVGGGVRDRETAKRLLGAGVDRVVVGTVAYRQPQLLVELLDEFSPERVVVAADYRDGTVVTKGWTESQGISLLEALKRLESVGVKNVLTTAVGQDGTGTGPDVETTREVCSNTSMKVIASGGIRDIPDLGRLREAGAQGAVLGRAIYEETVRLREAKELV